MNKYFEDSTIPFISNKDVTVNLESSNPWEMKFTRFDFQQIIVGDQFPENWYPGLMSRYMLKVDENIYVMDDYGDLVAPISHDVLPKAITHVDWKDINSTIISHDDYGNCILLDFEFELEGVYLTELDEYGDLGDVKYVGNSIPGRSKYLIIPNNFKEHGWDVLAQHATMDGMLCVRWLGLYGSPPSDHAPKTFGFNSEPVWSEAAFGKRASRKFSRKTMEFETRPQRELAAEVFPMEMGSLLVRHRYHEEEFGYTIGLVIDPSQSELRRIYPQDCYSESDGTRLEACRDYLEYWEGWSGARQAWESCSVEERLRRTYTEGFIADSTPCAVIMYGNREDMTEQDESIIKKFKKNGYPIYYLEVVDS